MNDFEYLINQVKELKEEMFNDYKQSTYALTKNFRQELETAGSYHGREILELLQNIDDALVDTNIEDGTAYIQYDEDENVLTVSNTGTMFNFEGIKSIMVGHLSQKDDESIGNKGSGFRSVLNWSNKIEIFSGPYNLRFSKEYSKRKFMEISNEENVAKQIENSRKNESLSLPIFSMPEFIDKYIKDDYDTVIKIFIDENLNKGDFSLNNQLMELDNHYKTLIFLPNIKSIRVNNSGEEVYYKKVIKDNNILSLFKETSNEIIEKKYFYNTKYLDSEATNKYISVAVPFDELEESNLLYCYFPTKERIPFNVLMHAPFILDQNRNYISNDNSGINKRLFIDLIDLFIETLNQFSETDVDQLRLLKIVTPKHYNPTWSFDGKLKEFNLSDYFFKKILEANIIPLLNGKFTTMSKDIKRCSNELPNTLKNNQLFENFIININDSHLNYFILKLMEFNHIDIEIDVKELSKLIEKIVYSDHMEIAEVFLWWNKYYKYKSYHPNILKDLNENIIIHDENIKIYLPTEKGINSLGDNMEFIKLVVLHPDLTKCIIDKIKDTDYLEWIKNEKSVNTPDSEKRLLDRYSSNFKYEFVEQSSRIVILRTVFNQVKTIEQSKITLKWMYELYTNNQIEISNSIKELGRILVPTQYGLKSHTDTYIGIKHNHQIGTSIFSKIDGYYEIDPFAIDDLTNIDELQKIKNFLVELGVNLFPKIIKTNNLYDRSFTEYLHNNNIVSSNLNYIDTYVINDLYNILNNLPTSDIVTWLNHDIVLSELLYSNRSSSHAKRQRNNTGQLFNDNTYLKYIFNNAKWVLIDGRKYSPNQIVLFKDLDNKIDGIYGISENNLMKIVGKEAINLFDFKKSMALLDDITINNILRKLPDIPNSSHISIRLYNDLLKFKIDSSPVENYSVKGIKVLCNDNQYISNENVFYANQTYIDNKNYNFIKINFRRSIKTIENWLGVKKYDVIHQLEEYVEYTNYSQKFKEFIDYIKVSVLASIDNNTTNIANLKKLNIIACSYVYISSNDNYSKLENYFYVPEDDNYYIKLETKDLNENFTNLNQKFINAIYEIFRIHMNMELKEDYLKRIISLSNDDKKDIAEEQLGFGVWDQCYESIFEITIMQEKMINWFKKYNLDNTLIDQLTKISLSSLSLDDYELLIHCLLDIDKEVSELNMELSNYSISFVSYWNNKINKYKESKNNSYKKIIFDKLSNTNTIESKSTFLQELKIYGEYTIKSDLLETSLKFDYETIINDVFFSNNNTNNGIDLESIYNNNLTKFTLDAEEINSFMDFIDSSIELKSLMFFFDNDIYTYINNKYLEYIELKKKNNNTISDEKDVLLDYSDKVVTSSSEQERNINQEDEVFRDQIINDDLYNPKNPNTKTDIEEGNKVKDLNGKKAEKLAYNKLINKFPTLKWTSENSEITPYRNTSSKYDMRYEEDGQTYYIEIKKFGQNFYMSLSEYEFAKKNNEHYFLYFVDIDKKELFAPRKITDFDENKKVHGYRFKIKIED